MGLELFNWHQQRARLARYGKALSSWIFLLELSVLLLFVGGVGLLIIGVALGWALLGLAALPAMVVQWYKHEVGDVPRDTTRNTIDARMDADLLGLLPEQPTPKQIALLLPKIVGGMFFEGRFGIGGGFLKEVASEHKEDTKSVFDEALRIADTVGGRVSAPVIILAMLRQIPARATVLGHLQLDETDLIRGIEWYHHIESFIEAQQKRPRVPGGIGRDWSFGWIPQLSHFGVNVSQSNTVTREGLRGDTLQQIINSLGGNSGTIALVGKDGVGKTEIIYELADKLMHPDTSVAKTLRYNQVFMLDASRIVSAASQRGELERLVMVLLSEAYAAKNIIVCFDNAELFFQEGVGSVDLTTLLQPIIEAGRVRIIMTIDEQHFLQLAKRTPTLTNAISKIMIQPTGEDETLKILEDHLAVIEHKRKVTYVYQALKEAYKLSQRYIYDVAMPGQAISLLDAAAEYAESNGIVSAQSVQKAIERSTGIKAGAASDQTERETLLNLESLIHERMIGQERAVAVVSDALRRARAGVRNQSRPVGTFLFLGPTGVGKTELAKSLAAVYFGGESNIIRLDMNEFVSPDDVQRLIADGADDPGSLTAQVMRQPFSVVLLDEIEKAHSSVLTTLLQLLDEGILRDVRGREVSFRDTVVIATSNAGADRVREYIERGYSLEQFEETFLNELISSHLFHPEFLNRFDEIVVFGPLNKEQLLRVVDLILVGINKNLAEQKITITVSPEAKEYLVEAGYDPRLGARPMRRVVQRAVESTVAKQLLAGEVTAGGTVIITLEQVQAILGSHTGAQAIVDENKK